MSRKYEIKLVGKTEPTIIFADDYSVKDGFVTFYIATHSTVKFRRSASFQSSSVKSVVETYPG